MITAKFKDFFIDRAKVLKKIGEARAKSLMRGGGRIRITAQRSMRYRENGASRPGDPPFAHKKTGALLRKLLFFIYDDQSDSVVVGPVVARKGEAPRLNEFGGVIRNPRTRFITGNRGAPRTRIPAGAFITYPPRPFMSPALEKQLPRLPKDWANSVQGP